MAFSLSSNTQSHRLNCGIHLLYLSHASFRRFTKGSVDDIDLTVHFGFILEKFCLEAVVSLFFEKFWGRVK